MAKNIIEHAEAAGDFQVDVSGFVYFWPSSSDGMFSAHDLRTLADELDKINEPLNKHIEIYFEEEEAWQEQKRRLLMESDSTP